MHDIGKHTPYIPPKGDAKPIIELVNVSFAYANAKMALNGLNLTIYEGDRLALVGHNGSGKTTLAKLITGIYKPVSGDIIRHRSDGNLNIGMVFQDPDDQLFSATLFDDIAFGLLNRGMPLNEIEQRIHSILKMLNLEDFAYKEPHNMSYGQKKRAALASILVLEPELLILDEPTAGLDPESEEELLAMLESFNGTLICISHNLFFLYHLCNRALVLKNGRVHHDFTMTELLSHRSSLREHGLDFTFRFSCCEVGTSIEIEESSSNCVENSDKINPIIEIRDLEYKYPDGTQALKRVSLKVSRGERVAIVGENGAGKSTLALILSGVLEGHGSYVFNGKEVSPDNRGELWRHIGFVFQNPMDQLFCADCYEEIAFGLKSLGLADDEISRRVGWALQAVGLEGMEKEVPHRLSGGEQKRITIASVLGMLPDVLILDEPTNNLDPENEKKLIEILDDFDKTLIIISHDLCFLSFLCDRAIVMHKGRIIGDLPFNELLQSEAEKLKLHHHHGHHHRCCKTIREIFLGLSGHDHNHHHHHV